jgi:hypothetical protein
VADESETDPDISIHVDVGVQPRPVYAGKER